MQIVITGSSRPQLWPYFWESFQKYVHIRNKPSYLIHEDVIYSNESVKVLDYIKSNVKGTTIVDNPPIGLGPTLDNLIKKHIKDEFILYLQEDWEFERPIDIDHLIWIMQRNTEINCIFFNKYENFKTLNGIEQPQYTFDDIDLCLYHSWTFLPGIWRMSHVRKYWRMRKERPEGYFTNSFGSHEQRSNHEYAKKILGVYAFGKTGTPRYVRHLGNDWRMADWRRINGKPGGANGEILDNLCRAEWLPSIEDRPTQRKYTKDEIKKLVEEEPVEARLNE